MDNMAKARLVHCKKAAKIIYEVILQKGEVPFLNFCDKDMINLRKWTEELNQCVHELNAYRNVIVNQSDKMPHRIGAKDNERRNF